MNDLLIISGFALLWLGMMIVEYRNPLWSEIVRHGEPIADTSGVAKSVQMVFFWRSAPTFKRAEEADYWNSMDVFCLKDGLFIRRPLFLFGRRSVFLPWSKLELGAQSRTWFLPRRSIHIKGSELYLSISEKAAKHWPGSNVQAKS